MAGERRGVVVEAGDDGVVVLSPDGAFLRVDRRRIRSGAAALGAEIVFSTGGRGILAVPARRRWAAALAAACLVAVAMPAISYWQGQKAVYAHVSVDLPDGSSYDLAVNGSGRVIGVRLVGAGSEGAVVEEDFFSNIPGRDVAGAVQALLASRAGPGASEASPPGPEPSERGPVVIAVSPAGRSQAGLVSGLAKKMNEATDQIDSMLESDRSNPTRVVTLSLQAAASEADALRMGASEAGLSLGQYLIYLEAVKSGIDVDLSRLHGKGGVVKALKDSGASLQSVLRAASSERDFVKLFQDHGTHGKGKGHDADVDRGEGHAGGRDDGENRDGHDGPGDSDGDGRGHGDGDGRNGDDRGHGHGDEGGQVGGPASVGETGAGHAGGSEARGAKASQGGRDDSESARGDRHGDGHDNGIGHDDRHQSDGDGHADRSGHDGGSGDGSGNGHESGNGHGSWFWNQLWNFFDRQWGR